MIILDTNVISETMRPEPDPAVIAWLDGQAEDTVYLSSISVAELKYGAEAMPKGKRRDRLLGFVRKLVEVDFRDRVLAFDQDAAMIFGSVMAIARSKGKAVSQSDGMIAALALAHRNCSIATRDEAPFEALSVDVINPWTG